VSRHSCLCAHPSPPHLTPPPSPTPPPPPSAPPPPPLAPTAATGPAPRLPVGDDAIPPETPDIVGSWVTYRRLVAAGIGPASTEALLGPGAAGPPVVDIRILLYSGVRAQQRAHELRVEAT